MSSSESRYRRHRFALEFVKQCVWLYFRFALSYRGIEEMTAKRGVPVTYETIREWCQKFGSLYELLLRRKRARIGSSGTWTKSSSRQMASNIYGEPWIKTEWSSIFWFSRSVTVGQLCASFANCCM